jgi:hypothetical protein
MSGANPSIGPEESGPMATIKGLVGTVSRAIPPAADPDLAEKFRTGLGVKANTGTSTALYAPPISPVVAPVVKKPNPLGAQDATISNFLNPSTAYKGR